MLEIEKEFSSDSSVLVILSARLNQFYSFYYELPFNNSKLEVTVLGQENTLGKINQSSINKKSTKTPRISLATLEPDLKKTLLTTQYDSLVILYNNREGRGYSDLDGLALKIKATKKYVYDIDGLLHIFDKSFLAYKNQVRPQEHAKDVKSARHLAEIIPRKINIINPRKISKNPTIIFLTTQGFDLPAARVRCFFLAEALADLGWPTEIVSTVTHLGFPEEWEMSLTDKVLANRKILDYLKQKEDYILYIQRLDYQAWIAQKLFAAINIPFILDYDDWDLNFFPMPEIFQPEFTSGEELLNYFITHSLFNVVSSRYLENYFLKLSDKVLYLPTAVHTPNFPNQHPPEKRDKITISWLGTVMRLSNMEDLIFTIEAFLKISKNYPQASLEILASGRYLKRVKGFVKGRDNIIFKGWIEPKKIAEYLSSIDIGLLPLVEDSQFNRAKSPTKLFEYMYLGKAVLASAVGEANYIIKDGENGFLFRDETEFIDKLRQLIENDALRERMGLNAGRAIIDNYTLEKQAEKLAAYLKEKML